MATLSALTAAHPLLSLHLLPQLHSLSTDMQLSPSLFTAVLLPQPEILKLLRAA
jgi:hypothetical protein